MRHKVLIHGGTVLALFKDGIAHSLLERLGGTASIRRASHVEAPANPLEAIEFTVDLTPSNGPILNGFPSYESAVAAEVDWLHANTLNPNKKTIQNTP